MREGGFRDPDAARRRLPELFTDTTEMLALARLSGILRDLLAACPDPDAALLHLARLVEVRGSRLQLYRAFLDHPAWLDRFVHVVASSRYLADILVRNPEHLALLSDAATLSRPRPLRDLEREMGAVRRLHATEREKLDALRRVHRREALRIGAADLLGFLDLDRVTRQISDLADAVAAQCLAVLSGARRSGLVLIALGKWGGQELNYSSDIDLMFVAPRAELGRASDLARRLVQALGERTAEGVVYRVDLRLRPYGAEGALVIAPEAFERYLRLRAQPAERQALLKARAAAGDVAAGRRLLRRVLPHVFRDGPLARAQVRRLKARIERQLHARGQAAGHLKLAPGGIRDVEFLAQALQLESGLAGGNTLAALQGLEAARLLSADDARTLRDAYVFLRAVENRMQLMENQQVYRLPRSTEDLERLGRTMGLPGPHAHDRLLDAYDARSRRVRALFDRVHDASPAALGDGAAPLGDLAERLDPQTLRLCARLRARVGAAGDPELEARRGTSSIWTAAVAAGDRPDLFRRIAGLFAARRVDVRSGDFARLVPARRTIGVFEVLLPPGAPADFWDSFRADLAIPEDRLIEEIGRALPRSAALSPLLPVRIEVRGDELHLHSTDAIGFVFEMAATLDALDLPIERAVIRTLGDEIYDTFRVKKPDARRLRAAAALVRQFIHLLPRSPDPAQALRQFAAFLRRVFARKTWMAELRDLESSPVLSTLADLMGVSRFLWEDFLLLQHENLFPVVRDVPALERRKPREALERELARAGSADELNRLKDRELFRIDLRHLTRRSDFPEFMEATSDLAEAVIGRAAELCGPSRGPWCLAALGKFGGRELGIASDLDLLAVYERDSCVELVKRLVQAIRGRREGSFSIDLRLRPHGDAGPLASSLAAFREYYSERGPARPFERLALVKLRPVAGDAALGRRLLEARDAFVYAGSPVDLENLLHLRKRQAAELVRPGELHAKYGPGGLVDVEYFVQARQIEAGVRAPGTLGAVEGLVRAGRFPPGFGAEVATAYLFLRRLVEALRVVRGHAQDAAIPPRDSREFDYLVRRLGYASPAALEAEIRQRMSFARHLWGALR